MLALMETSMISTFGFSFNSGIKRIPSYLRRFNFAFVPMAEIFSRRYGPAFPEPCFFTAFSQTSASPIVRGCIFLNGLFLDIL